MLTLKSRIWVQALIRRAEVGGAAGFVVRAGDDDAGSVLVKVSTLDGLARLYTGARNFDGSRLWVQPLGPDPVAERDVDAYAGRRHETDPDIWVVEIEDRQGRHFLTEPVEGE
mgnify:CR=1 FL=1|tara:strand:+ start:528 stop:866 length:339 start_codon:yes stop_codon:yes gene_type:complete